MATDSDDTISSADQGHKTVESQELDKELKLQRARQTLKRFSEGIGSGQAPYDTARQHDLYLYQKL